MPRISALALAPIAVLSSPAWAGEDVLYGPIPEWVEQAALPSGSEDAPSTLIADWQHRIEGGVVTSYFDSAVRIDNPQSAREQGTITLPWLPDKGDLTVHRVEILRGSETIDVLANGATFDVLRRERGLERRLLDGQLTATMAVPGLQVGDILRVTHSQGIDDQALGDEVQVQQFLRAEPWQVAFSRAIVSWPTGEEVFWRAEDDVVLAEPVERGGYNWLTAELPLAERPDMPGDAPWRYRRPAVLRVGTFDSWEKLSRVMYPHFTAAAQLAPEGEVAAQARAIMARSEDPLDRMAAAVQLVQDEISYLLNGLEGGNYLPQSAAETWDKRYGDCKAKSVLLHALLQEMGIESETVLVHSRFGDAAPELLPVPGVFDHMIVRARVDGKDYWLDGTSSATRRHTLAEVPPFHYALPLRAEGADLVEMVQADKPWPDTITSVVTDYSAGPDLPAPFELTMTMFGPRSGFIRKAADEQSEDSLRKIARSFGRRGGSKGVAVSSVTLDYDDEMASGIVTLRGVAGSEFDWEDGRLVLDPKLVPDPRFDANRGKREWREIPVRTNGPSRNRLQREFILPSDPAFKYEGFDTLDESFANWRIVGAAGLNDGRFSAEMEHFASLGEIAAGELGAAKRDARRIKSIETRVVAPEDMQWRWDRSEAELAKRIAPARKLYTDAMQFADKDDHSPLAGRARLLAMAYQWDDALADLDTLVGKDESSRWLLQRANVHRSLGDDDATIADFERAYELEPDTSTATALAIELAYAGRVDDALDLIDSLPVTEEDLGRITVARATALGLAERNEEAIEVLAEALDEAPNDAWVLNANCWIRGLFAIDTDNALDSCTKGIERADNSASILDSRAVVHYRRGDLDLALADLDAALSLNPAIAASRYVRGIIKLEQGNREGRKDIERALRMSPELARIYARHGIAPPQ